MVVVDGAPVTWERDGEKYVGYTEISSFGPDFKFEQVMLEHFSWRLAGCAGMGFKVKSQRTGKVVPFMVVSCDADDEGDILAYKCVALNEDARSLDTNLGMVVFND